jgi:hypothetical protein
MFGAKNRYKTVQNRTELDKVPRRENGAKRGRKLHKTARILNLIRAMPKDIKRLSVYSIGSPSI